MTKHTNPLLSTAALLANVAIGTQNYLTDVLHIIKASGVAEIINEFESGKEVSVEETVARYGITGGDRKYTDWSSKELLKGCIEVVDTVTYHEVKPEDCADTLVRQLIFWEAEHSPLYVETFERRFPEEFRETAFYKEFHDLLLEKLGNIFEDAEALRSSAKIWAKYYAFDVSEKTCLIIRMLINRGYETDEITPFFKTLSESTRAFCELVAENYLDKE